MPQCRLIHESVFRDFIDKVLLPESLSAQRPQAATATATVTATVTVIGSSTNTYNHERLLIHKQWSTKRIELLASNSELKTRLITENKKQKTPKNSDSRNLELADRQAPGMSRKKLILKRCPKTEQTRTVLSDHTDKT